MNSLISIFSVHSVPSWIVRQLSRPALGLPVALLLAMVMSVPAKAQATACVVSSNDHFSTVINSSDAAVTGSGSGAVTISVDEEDAAVTLAIAVSFTNPANCDSSALSVTYSEVTGTDDDGIFTNSGGTITATPPTSIASGVDIDSTVQYTVTVSGHSDTVTANIKVVAVNDAPVLTALADESVTEDGTALAVTLALTDEESQGDLSVFDYSFKVYDSSNAEVVGDWFSFDSSTQTASFSPYHSDQAGVYSVEVVIVDGAGIPTHQISDSFALTVVSVNDPPVPTDVFLALQASGLIEHERTPEEAKSNVLSEASTYFMDEEDGADLDVTVSIDFADGVGDGLTLAELDLLDASGELGFVNDRQAGSYTLSYTATDKGTGAADSTAQSDTGGVSLELFAVNDPITSSDITPVYNTFEGTPEAGILAGIYDAGTVVATIQVVDEEGSALDTNGQQLLTVTLGGDGGLFEASALVQQLNDAGTAGTVRDDYHDLTIDIVVKEDGTLLNQDYTLSYTLHDGSSYPPEIAQTSGSALVDIIVAPLADAGRKWTALSGDTVTLSGSDSVDVEGDGLPLTYIWEQLEGVSVTLSDNAVVAPTFIAPEEAGKLVFRLTVGTDPATLTDTDLVSVYIQSQAHLDLNREVLMRQLVLLSGDVSAAINQRMGIGSAGRNLSKGFTTADDVSPASVWLQGSSYEIESRITSSVLNWDGEVNALQLGVDATLTTALAAGIILSTSESDVDWNHNDQEGAYASEMSMISPWLGLRLGALKLWATSGQGDISIQIDQRIDSVDQRFQTTGDLENEAYGASLSLGGWLVFKSERQVSGFEVQGQELLAAVPKIENEVNRSAVQFSPIIKLKNGGVFMPAFEVGTREEILTEPGSDTTYEALARDGEETSVRLHYSSAASGMVFEMGVRSFESDTEGYSEEGTWMLWQYDPGLAGRGVAVSFRPSAGQLASNASQLWQYHATGNSVIEGLTQGYVPESSAVDTSVSYALPMGSGWIVSPQTSYRMANGERSNWVVGSQFEWNQTVRLGLLGERRWHDQYNRPSEDSIKLQGTFRF
ncbi:MAG: PKD domain-containing protein [Gammaproteobacteria bacterium]